ncbi:DNA binding domain-containing protein, excisionase family [Nocardioides terrae]|uniref:DNA binding domain-containing protein, excisionase family n=1 Tax=Nocardioides terrae TaxID=574651 RepID=A0A1I1FHY6_9ACTN|nr:helix-turn-helix domain-containing protein [Nocardioides terrae]SFB98975.1 DNA binding domain-containing protein, excisionase family [Nocardioides terrae]
MRKAPADTATNPYLSLTDAAEIVGQSVKTLRRRISAGTLPAYRFGPRSIRVRFNDLEATGHRIPSARTGE